MRASCEPDGRMKPDRDSLDEFFEYEAEDFLVYLALLITEGRTPEHSVKGRTEGLHCPPAQSCQPEPTKHECSDKLAQCCQARKTRSEVTLLWRNNIPIMVEVMLLPDCCYSDEGSGTEGNDLNDPAMKQDALLLERWTLESVPRQSGDRFIEEKTLLLAIRSYVFFSQLSAWLSVSHGVVPRNIIYRVSAADKELQWNFTHSPTEHVFPVPNVSHNVALKVRVQSLPRQSSYPVLNCSIHSNLGFYEKSIPSPREFREKSQHSVPTSQHTCSKQTWTVEPGGFLQARTSLSMNLSLPDKSMKLISGGSNSYAIGTSPSKIQCFSMMRDTKNVPLGSSVRNFKSMSLVDVPNNSQQIQTPETNPLIGSLIQERQEVIARIAQRLLQCDQSSSHIANRPFKMSDSNPLSFKIFRNPCEDENANNIDRETPVVCPPTLDLNLTPNSQDRKQKNYSDTPITSSQHTTEARTSPKPQARRRLILVQTSEPISSTFQQSVSKHTPPALSLSSKENVIKLPETEELKPSGETEKNTNKGPLHISNHNTTNIHMYNSKPTNPAENQNNDYVLPHVNRSCNVEALKTCYLHQMPESKCTENIGKNSQGSDYNTQIHSTANCVKKDRESQKCKETQNKQKPAHDENEDPAKCDCGTLEQESGNGRCLTCERLKSTDQAKLVPLRPSNNWRKKGFQSLDGISTKAFHPCTGLPLLSSPVPQRKTQSGYFDLDTSLLQLKGLATKRRHHCEKTEDGVDRADRPLSCSAPPTPCLSLLGNFEESVLNYRFETLGTVEGFTADVGASGIFCPTHVTLPVGVSFFSVSDDNAPSPYMGNITLESLGKRGYRIPPSGTIQVTLFNPNKTVVKMFVVKYDLQKMPANHQTFLRQRTFSFPVKRDRQGTVPENSIKTEERTLRYLIHLRFQSSKSGKIYLHRDVKLLFSRKSMEVDSGAAYELKSYIETPTNPQFSARC